MIQDGTISDKNSVSKVQNKPRQIYIVNYRSGLYRYRIKIKKYKYGYQRNHNDYITSASIRYFIEKEKVAKNMHIKFGERVKSRIK